MLRIIFASIVITSVVANRVQHRHAEKSIKSGDQSKSQNQFGASCDDLETMFHNRVVAFQAALDVLPDVNTIGRTTQVRLLMRSYGVVRTLRRARTCSWAVESDSGDIEQMRDIVQTLLAGNPCAQVARAELEAGSSAETSEVDMESVRRSMSILMSENCEVTEETVEQVESTTLDAEAALDAQMNEAEANLQDNIDEFADASEGESEAAFIQSDARTFHGFMRGLGVAFLFVLLLLACAGAAVVIGAMIGYALLVLANAVSPAFLPCQGFGCLAQVYVAFFGGAFLGGGIGLAGCSYQLYTQMLPRLSQ